MKSKPIYDFLFLMMAGISLVLTMAAWLSFEFGKPIAQINPAKLQQILMLTFGFYSAAAYLLFLKRTRSNTGYLELVFASCAVQGAIFVLFFLRSYQVSTTVILISFVASILFMLLIFKISKTSVKIAVIGITIAVGIVTQLAYSIGVLPIISPRIEKNYAASSLYGINVTKYLDYIDRPQQSGGGIDKFSDKYLLVTSEADIYTFNEGTDGLIIEELDLKVPMNTQEFLDDVEGEGVHREWFRVADILTIEKGKKTQLYVSHHFWNRSEKCSTLRISLFEENTNAFGKADGTGDWQTIYETDPCLPIERTKKGKKSNWFGGNQLGGRMVMIDPGTMLISVGDFEFDGWNSVISLPQKPDNSYGKMIRLDIDTREKSVFSIGHRNPQGLHIDASGNIWSTEHGPQGGDELNLIVEGNNYGWPAVTHGVEYGTHSWPLNTRPGSHQGYVQPVHSWVPSIAISNLMSMRGSAFEFWKDDLILGMMKWDKLYRIRTDENRAVVIEPIGIGMRTRDLLEADDGGIVVWREKPIPTLAFLRPATDSGTAEALITYCKSCHNLTEPAEKLAVGPSLAGIVGRKIASVDDYTYSDGLKQKTGSWTKERLEQFLENPQDFAPGTVMGIAPISDPEYRAKIIRYLETL